MSIEYNERSLIMSLENLKLEIEKKMNRSEERYLRYLDNDKSYLEEIRINTYQEVLDMIQKEQEKAYEMEQSSEKELDDR